MPYYEEEKSAFTRPIPTTGREIDRDPVTDTAKPASELERHAVELSRALDQQRAAITELAVRLAVVMRPSTPEKEPTSPGKSEGTQALIIESMRIHTQRIHSNTNVVNEILKRIVL